jgi:hypothetical protein
VFVDGSAQDRKEWTVMADPATGKKRLFLNNHGINQMGMWKPVTDIPKADKLWAAAYGSVTAGPFNTGGCTAGPYVAQGAYTCSCFWPRAFTCTNATLCATAPDGGHS